ncbi:MAG: hypothetical protein IJX88_02615 [Clostridia bacterium]|nr:hypothetical protein [Clostridia bacterium]
MGKKKSVVLMTLLTIVIVVLCALTAFPAFTLPGTEGVKKWNPVVLQYDLGADLGGGYYAYYYPEGVISETEYNENVSTLQEAVDNATADEKAKAEEELNDYKDAYTQVKGSTLYFSTEEKLNIVDGDKLTDEFVKAFKAASDEIADRFAKKEYSDYRVAVVDGYSLKVQLPASEDSQKASAALSYLSNTGEMTVKKGGEVIKELEEEGAKASDLIKSVSIATRYKTAYLRIRLTAAGEAMFQGYKGELSASTDASTSTDTSSITTLDIVVGEETVAQLYSDSVSGNDKKELRAMFVDEVNRDYLETIEILFTSALQKGGFEVTFEADAVRSFEPVYGENALTLLFIAVGVTIVAVIALAIVKMGRYGVVSLYATLSYCIITLICFAFITSGTFEVSLGTVLVFLVGLILVNLLQYHIYNAIKAEFALGKTVESSVKGGYKKTLWGIIDIYAVLVLGALAFLVATAGIRTVALQALICIIAGAFINLLWARAINFTYLSASKDKYKYYRFVREDDDDE